MSPIKLPSVKIKITAQGRGQLYIDGFKVPFLVAFDLSVGVDQESVLNFRMLAGEIDIEGPFNVAGTFHKTL